MEQPFNLDRSQRLVIDTSTLAWTASPAAGVWRKSLEREGAERGQVTSLVRYDPGARFAPHSHPLGEEILVLSGVFEDEQGRYPAGCYFRNPPGSQHAPASPKGCELLVKLNLFQSGDDRQVRVNTRSVAWQHDVASGVELLPLHRFGREQVRLERWPAAADLGDRIHLGGEELFVLEGSFSDADGSYGAGSWIRLPAGSRHQPRSAKGCVLWVKSGYLGPQLSGRVG